MAKKRIYLAVTNDLVTDNRVHKVATTLLKSGASVTLIGCMKTKNPPALNRTYNIKRFKLIFKRGPYFYLEYNIRLFLFLLFHRFDIVVANDLDTLLGSYIACKLKFKKIVYDSHEYFTEVPELFNRKFPKRVWTILERIILPKIKYAYTVSESIALTYNKLYNIDMKIIRNVPNHYDIEKIIPKKGPKQILYQGSLNIGRGLEQMIDAMEFIENCELIIIGDGDITNQLKERIHSKNLNHKVTLKGRIPFENLMIETQKADLGIALEENLGLNYYYALPNKLFDYIQAGVPVLVSPFPEMQKIVNKYEIGTVYDHKSPQELAKTINEIFVLKNRYQKWKHNTDKAAQELCWENEEKILMQLYKQAGLVF